MDQPPEQVTTDCGGRKPRKLTLLRDEAGAIVRRSTHPKAFPQVRKVGERVAYQCSQCNGQINVAQDDSMTWQRCVEIAGSRNHTRTCTTRRKRKADAPQTPEAKRANHRHSIDRVNKRAPPVLPEDAGALRATYPFPPLSVVRMDLAPFLQRTREWLTTTGLDDGAGRDTDLIKWGELSNRNGTSLFNPTLAEGIVRFFAPDPDKLQRPVVVLDPCAGGATRGVVCAKLGYLYVGIDCSKKQVEANEAQRAATCRGARHQPIWICGDGEDSATHLAEALRSRGLPADTPADLVFTCPPYWNLEVRRLSTPLECVLVG